MSTLTPNTSTGKALLHGTQSWRARDDAADPKTTGGAYNHSNFLFSATEANEWVSFFQYISGIISGTVGAIQVRNETGSSISAGPVSISGWSAAHSAFLIVAANADSLPAYAVITAALPTSTNAFAYGTGVLTSALSTGSSSVGAPVYLASGGGLTLTLPAASKIRQIVGRVKTVANPGDVQAAVCEPLPLLTGTSSTTACAGNDSRLSDARTPVGTALTQNKIWVGNGSNLAAEADLPSGGGYVNLALNPGFETVLPGTHTDAIKLLTTGSKNSCMPGWQFAGEGGGLRAESDTDTITGASYRSAKIKATTPSAPVKFFQEWSAAEYLASLAHSFRGKRLVFAIDMCFGAFLEGSFGTIKPYIYCDGTGGGTTYGTTYTSNSNWVRRVVSAVIPEDCTEIKFGIEVDTEETKVTVYVDNAMVVQSDAALTSLPYLPRLPASLVSPDVTSGFTFVYTTPADTTAHYTGDGTADTDWDVNASRPAWATGAQFEILVGGSTVNKRFEMAYSGAGSTQCFAYVTSASSANTLDTQINVGADGQMVYLVDDTSVDVYIAVNRWVGEAL